MAPVSRRHTFMQIISNSVDNSYILLYTVYEVNDMRIIINNRSMEPIYEQLISQIKSGIISGEIADGEVLPSVRTMSADLRISALTVKKAYDRLEDEGFVTTVHGKGTFVNTADREMAAEARRKAVEDDFAAAVQRAKAAGLDDDEIRAALEIILEETDR